MCHSLEIYRQCDLMDLKEEEIFLCLERLIASLYTKKLILVSAASMLPIHCHYESNYMVTKQILQSTII